MIQESIAQYPGKYPYPYSIMSNRKKCGKRSAYSKPGGYEPLCYVSDITGGKENDVKTQAQIELLMVILFTSIRLNIDYMVLMHLK